MALGRIAHFEREPVLVKKMGILDRVENMNRRSRDEQHTSRGGTEKTGERSESMRGTWAIS